MLPSPHRHVAQLEERQPTKLKVGGSNPLVSTTAGPPRTGLNPDSCDFGKCALRLSGPGIRLVKAQPLPPRCLGRAARLSPAERAHFGSNPKDTSISVTLSGRHAYAVKLCGSPTGQVMIRSGGRASAVHPESSGERTRGRQTRVGKVSKTGRRGSIPRSPAYAASGVCKYEDGSESPRGPVNTG